MPFPCVQVIAPNHQIYALKRIRLHGRDSESATGFVDEIRMLHKLRKKENIIQLIDAEVRGRRDPSSSSSILCPGTSSIELLYYSISPPLVPRPQS